MPKKLSFGRTKEAISKTDTWIDTWIKEFDRGYDKFIDWSLNITTKTLSVSGFANILKLRLGDSVEPTKELEVNGTSRLGDPDAGNYTEIEEADGTIVFKGNATVFEDIFTPLSAAKVPAANAPTWTNFISNLKRYTYGLNDFQEFDAEVAHAYKEGSKIEFHIHGATNGLEGVDKKINFEVEYEIINNSTVNGLGDAYTGTTIMNGEMTIPANTTDRTSFVLDVGIDITGIILQGASVVGRMRRIASSGTEPAADPFVTQLGIHIEKDTVGSRTELTK